MSSQVKFTYKNIDFDFSLEESMELLDLIKKKQNALKIKCPTCRCMIFPERKCFCCCDTSTLTDEEMKF